MRRAIIVLLSMCSSVAHGQSGDIDLDRGPTAELYIRKRPPAPDSPSLSPELQQLLTDAAEKRDAKVAEACMESIQAPLKVLDQALAGKQFLVGDRFTVADLNVAATLYRLLTVDLAHVPNVKTWLHRCFERPAALAMRKMRE